MATVSICLLSWNHAEFIADSLQSIRDQTFTDFEVVIVDNGSLDGSPEILATESEKFTQPVTIIRNPSNLGIAPALNQALAIATGDFFVAFSADDIMFPDRLETQINEFRALGDEFAVLASAVVIFGGSIKSRVASYNSRASEKSVRLGLLRGSIPLAPGAMVRTSPLRKIGGFDPECPIEDYDCWLRLVFGLGMRIQPSQTPVAMYRQHDSNATSRTAVMRMGVLHSLAKLDLGRLSFRERRARLAYIRQLMDAPVGWDEMIGALMEGSPGDVRGKAVQLIFRSSSTGISQRAKALVFLLIPKTTSRRVRARVAHHESIAPESAVQASTPDGLLDELE